MTLAYLDTFWFVYETFISISKHLSIKSMIIITIIIKHERQQVLQLCRTHISFLKDLSSVADYFSDFQSHCLFSRFFDIVLTAHTMIDIIFHHLSSFFITFFSSLPRSSNYYHLFSLCVLLKPRSLLVVSFFSFHKIKLDLIFKLELNDPFVTSKPRDFLNFLFVRDSILCIYLFVWVKLSSFPQFPINHLHHRVDGAFYCPLVPVCLIYSLYGLSFNFFLCFVQAYCILDSYIV